MDKSNDNIPRAEMKLAERLAREGYQRQQDNRRFHTATPEAKRVIIAQDVLRWLDEGKLTAKPGSYLLVPEGVVEEQKVNGYDCVACALGAVFACAVERGVSKIDTVSIGSTNVRGREYHGTLWGAAMRDRLESYFSRHDLCLIESAFEGRYENLEEVYRQLSEEDQEACYAFHDKYPGTLGNLAAAESRMRAIMTNIIDNGGTFVP